MRNGRLRRLSRMASGLHKEKQLRGWKASSRVTKMSNLAENMKIPERKQGPETMRTNLATVLDPSRRSNDARAFETDLRPQILDLELGMGQQRVLMAAGAHQFVFNCTPQVKSFLLAEGTDPKYGARHLKRAIERHLVFPLANLVATGQVRLVDFVRVDLLGESKLTFVKEAEGAMVPVLLERYGAAAAMPAAAAARAARPVIQRKEFGAGSQNENK